MTPPPCAVMWNQRDPFTRRTWANLEEMGYG
jgi:hypothetical protein